MGNALISDDFFSKRFDIGKIIIGRLKRYPCHIDILIC